MKDQVPFSEFNLHYEAKLTLHKLNYNKNEVSIYPKFREVGNFLFYLKKITFISNM